MAKKTSSICLEEKLWDYVDEYRKVNKISSRSTAIEWMIISNMLGKVDNPLASGVEDTKLNRPFTPRNSMDDCLDDIENNMPD